VFPFVALPLRSSTVVRIQGCDCYRSLGRSAFPTTFSPCHTGLDQRIKVPVSQWPLTIWLFEFEKEMRPLLAKFAEKKIPLFLLSSARDFTTCGEGSSPRWTRVLTLCRQMFGSFLGPADYKPRAFRVTRSALTLVLDQFPGGAPINPVHR